MTYELERQQKERQALFEAEMQRRAEYLKVYLDFMNWAHYLQNHTRQDVHLPELAMFHKPLGDRYAHHIPSFKKWLHEPTGEIR